VRKFTSYARGCQIRTIGGRMEESGGEAQASAVRPGPARRLFKAAAVVLVLLFLFALGGALFVFYRFSAMREALSPAGEIYQEAAYEEVPAALPAPARMYVSTQSSETSSLTGFISIKELAQQAAILRETAAGGTGNPAMLDTGKAAAAALRYADRPIVRDFIAEAKKDPEFARALARMDPNDPLALARALEDIKGLEGMMLKFAMRKDFLPFVMEVTNDPEIKPMLGRLAPVRSLRRTPAPSSNR